MSESSEKHLKKKQGCPKGVKDKGPQVLSAAAAAAASATSQPVRRVVYVSGNSVTNIRPKHPLPSHLFLLPQYQKWPLIAAAIQPTTSSNPQAENVEIKCDPATVPADFDEKFLPKVDMLFDSESEAYLFYNTYAEKVGFFIRRSTLWASAKNIITRRTFVCSREGFCGKKTVVAEAKRPRPQTRIGCPASMTVRLTTNGKYRVAGFEPNHNHPLATALMMNILKSKKLKCKPRAVRANLRDKTVKIPDFETEDEAYEFYSMYAGRMGFSVRRASVTSNADNVVIRRMFVCSKEGFRDNKRGSKRVKNPRPETRTGCPACMSIKLTSDGKYQVFEFVTCHNHPLPTSSSPDISMPFDSESSDDDHSDVADEMQVNSSQKRAADVKKDIEISPGNIYINQPKRKKFGQFGDAGAMLEYLQKMQSESTSFFYTVKSDVDGRMMNFFWSDAKSAIDFNHFGDVVCLDTRYKVHGYGRPLALFTGLNHHRKTVIFGAALLYDESREAYIWLIDSFKLAMNGMQPKTIITERCASISDAVAVSLPGTAHRFCVWQIYQSSVEHLGQAFHGSKTLESDFKRCLFDLEDEDEFLSSWSVMVEKYDLKDNKWLLDLFSQKEKWALAYGRDTFYGDVKSVQQKESLNSDFKKSLSPGSDISSFFLQYEKLLEGLRLAEAQADFDASQNAKKIPSMRMLRQAATVYTPSAFKMFEKEFELYMDCLLYELGKSGAVCEYKITTDGNLKEHFVKSNSVDGTISCSCKKFEFIGIPCHHVLKVLDSQNIKDLPPQYILKRWRKDARTGPSSTQLDGDFQSSETKRLVHLCRMFGMLATRAADSADSLAYVENQLGVLLVQVEQVLQARPADIAALLGSACDRSHNSVESMAIRSLHCPASFGGNASDGDFSQG